MERVVLIGRSSPSDGICLKDERLPNGIVVETWSYTYNETYVYVPKKVLEKIARYYGKKVDELTDKEIEKYLIEVLDIEDKVEGKEHYFSKDW